MQRDDDKWSVKGARAVAQIVASATAEREFTTGEDDILRRSWGKRDGDRIISESIPADLQRNYNQLRRMYLCLRSFGDDCIPSFFGGNPENPLYFYVRDIVEAIMDEQEEMIISALEKEFYGQCF